MQQLAFDLKLTKDGSERYIALNKLLKYMRLCESGAMANALITDGLVTVNGSVDTRKRAKIKSGDVVIFNSVEIHVR